MMSIAAEQLTLRFSRDGGAVVIDVAGELDCSTAGALRERLVDVIDGQGSVSVIVGLGGMTFIDSTGIGVLVGANRRLRARGGSLSLLNPTSSVNKVLKLTGL